MHTAEKETVSISKNECIFEEQFKNQLNSIFKKEVMKMFFCSGSKSVNSSNKFILFQLDFNIRYVIEKALIVHINNWKPVTIRIESSHVSATLVKQSPLKEGAMEGFLTNWKVQTEIWE